LEYAYKEAEIEPENWQRNIEQKKAEMLARGNSKTKVGEKSTN